MFYYLFVYIALMKMINDFIFEYWFIKEKIYQVIKHCISNLVGECKY